MKITILLLLVFPVVMDAQVNRSATEFAKEKVEEYITTKLFKETPYKPLSYGELKTCKENDSDISCYISHKFEVTEMETNYGKKTAVQKSYNAIFYFSDKMKVLKAETSYSIER